MLLRRLATAVLLLWAILLTVINLLSHPYIRPVEARTCFYPRDGGYYAALQLSLPQMIQPKEASDCDSSSSSGS